MKNKLKKKKKILYVYAPYWISHSKYTSLKFTSFNRFSISSIYGLMRSLYIFLKILKITYAFICQEWNNHAVYSNWFLMDKKGWISIAEDNYVKTYI